MSIQPGSSKLAGRHSVPEIQKKQKSQIKKILLQLLNYQGALSVGYHRQYSFYRRRLFTAYPYTMTEKSPCSNGTGIAILSYGKYHPIHTRFYGISYVQSVALLLHLTAVLQLLSPDHT